MLTLAFSLAASAQADRYEQRYDLLVSQFGPAGIGVETVLDNWEKADSTNAKMLLGRFSYLFTKAQTGVVETRPQKKYLGMEPVLTLKDSLGNDVYYYQVNVFDDGLYADAMKAADKAISVWPARLDFRFMKANAFIAYEKESPDMALAFLMSLADEYGTRADAWMYGEEKAGDEFFQEAMQEYCYSFYTIGTSTSYDAFFRLSQKMSHLYPDNMDFLNNMGSYYLVAKEDYKSAYKCYNKVLKEDPANSSALRNGLVAARKQKNPKQERKYLEMMLKHGADAEKMQARTLLDKMKQK